MFYKNILKPLLFLFAPEKAHHLALKLFGIGLSIPLVSNIVKSLFKLEHSSLEKEVMGLKFKNPVGLAAGFDKDGKYLTRIHHLGFGFIEVGTVTPKPQEGNPQPRLFRLPEDECLINRMGFNNEGVVALKSRLQAYKKTDVIIGGNIGKNKGTPNANAVDDYIYCFNELYQWVDYFVVNVSSPNTPNLRELQEKEPLTSLLQTLQDANQKLTQAKPILLKIAPDMNTPQLDDILEIVKNTAIQGLVISNTTVSRADLKSSAEKVEAIGAGGLSGPVLQSRSTEMIRYVRSNAPEGMVIIGVGGINSYAAAKEKLDAGADLVQVYTGFIYEGPSLMRNINKALVAEN